MSAYQNSFGTNWNFLFCIHLIERTFCWRSRAPLVVISVMSTGMNPDYIRDKHIKQYRIDAFNIPYETGSETTRQDPCGHDINSTTAATIEAFHLILIPCDHLVISCAFDLDLGDVLARNNDETDEPWRHGEFQRVGSLCSGCCCCLKRSLRRLAIFLRCCQNYVLILLPLL